MDSGWVYLNPSLYQYVFCVSFSDHQICFCNICNNFILVLGVQKLLERAKEFWEKLIYPRGNFGPGGK